ncbi:MAG: REP-associated tyrosine transposase [Terriglobales bacterium]
MLRVYQLPRAPLRRHYGQGDLHFITTSCYRRKPLLGTARARDVFLKALEQVRRQYDFDVIGFVVMPEHVHLLLGEPEKTNPSVVMQALKQTVAQRLLRRPKKRCSSQMELWNSPMQVSRFWQRRFYDFNVFSEAKTAEKLKYMHQNPVKRGLVSTPELWRWSSYRVYAFGERGPVNMDWRFPPYTMKRTRVRRFGQRDEHDPVMIQHTHPAKSTRSAAPTARYSTRKSKP